MTQAKIVVTCPRCGSPDVTADAVARWDIDNQRWDMSATYDKKSCGTCTYWGDNFYETKVEDLTPNQKDFLDNSNYEYIIPVNEHKDNLVEVTRLMRQADAILNDEPFDS